jgi:acetyl-CoA carboxylase biotin carboxyl carrier protein
MTDNQNMDFDEITRILEIMREYDLVEFELERGDVKLRLQKAMAPAPPEARLQPVDTASSAAETPMPIPDPGPVDDTLVDVSSPIVGTFFRGSEPGAKPFTDIGETVTKGQVLCIIEAMKLMNEIHAEVNGVLVETHIENGQAVQYGERLFSIKPA